MVSVRVPISAGKIARVSVQDMRRVLQYRWTAQVQKNSDVVYAYRTFADEGKSGKYNSLHRFVLNAPAGVLLDHVDGDGLNCVRSNLRAATKSQNSCNRGISKCNTSGFKGVSWEKRSGRWLAAIQINSKKKYLGLYDDPRDAALAYDSAARMLHGEFARLNFPDLNQPAPSPTPRAPVTRSRVGAQKGGVARAAKLTPERRSEIARLANAAGRAKRAAVDSVDASA